ncbi:type II secretion system protein GspM [Saccharibacillus sp. CPCC 101409]|uniref:type II secretion system protein GspM n=1 Tax=Saccharibacillus sp. CPCC 101409 TaxID=3058041 RepID=UPI0026739048|nr:type II secretion system protein GspM [Saccharibacillus sp. CPCC 101409]MDO3412042.1 type II secretion system protein GspM [Saccharibacillus sp. CPCC 101409]
MQRILNNRQGVILGITGLFLLILVFYMLAVKPKVELWENQDNEIVGLQQQNTLMQSKIDELSKEESGSMTDEEMTAKLPPDADSQQIILDIQRIGQQASVRLSDATFAYEGEGQDASASTPISKALTAEGLRTVYVTVNVEGDYAHLRMWLDQLQQTERLTTVDSVGFQQPAVPNTLLAATVTFTASYYPTAAGTAADADGTSDAADAAGTTDATDATADPAQ